MNEHVCEWVLSNYADWMCKVDGCGEALSLTQTRDRLNEYETLKNQQAALLEALEKIARYGTSQPRPHSDLLLVQVWAKEAIRKAKGQ
jgi:hypothetical protein